MVKVPKFDERRTFGVSSSGRPMAPEEITIKAGMLVSLRYKGKRVAIDVTKVLKEKSEFEGVIRDFDNTEIEHEDLKQGDEVRFSYGKIEHIHHS